MAAFIIALAVLELELLIRPTKVAARTAASEELAALAASSGTVALV